ncbi:MAG: Gmad2 immunoglobulin-like domain-containing protein [Candidatus Paceibacterota bacterium]
MKTSNKVLFFTVAVLTLIFIFLWYYWDKIDEDENNNPNLPSAVVNDFSECMGAGYTISESYPRQCQTPDGRTFVEDVGNEMDKTDLIRITTPRPSDTVQSPMIIKGEARGFWFFEASFPIRLYDADGKELGVAIAQAKEDWMTEEFVQFEAILEFNAPQVGTGMGKLVLEKDNPSGLKENDDSLIVPVKFGESNQTQQISLFYYDESKDKDAVTGEVKCSNDGLAEVKRIVPENDATEIEDTVKLLLQGELTLGEQGAGITTEFPLEDLELEGASLNEEGELTLTFKDSQNKTSGGACRVGILWNQIEATARQFAEVRSVKFVPETLFQP